MLYDPREGGGGGGGGRGGEEEGEGDLSDKDPEGDSDTPSDMSEEEESEGGGEEVVGGLDDEVDRDAGSKLGEVTGQEGGDRKEKNEASLGLNGEDPTQTATPVPVTRQPAVYMHVKRDPEIQVYMHRLLRKHTHN